VAERCSGFAREQDLDPAGTAGSFEGFALVSAPELRVSGSAAA
jgi:hypothetical protein